jgi:hypothetical protein
VSGRTVSDYNLVKGRLLILFDLVPTSSATATLLLSQLPLGYLDQGQASLSQDPSLSSVFLLSSLHQ